MSSPADASVEDAPGLSFLAIKRQRNAIGSELRAHIYCYAKSKFIVTSIMSVPGSMILETGEPSVLPFEATNADLGRKVCEHLLAHDARLPPNMRGHKLRDWLAFRASRDRSVSSFESKSWRVMVETVNLFLNIETAPVRSLHPEISVKGVAQPRHEQLGATIRKTLKAANAIREAGII